MERGDLTVKDPIQFKGDTEWAKGTGPRRPRGAPLTHLPRQSSTWGSRPRQASCTRRQHPPVLCCLTCLSDNPPRPEEPLARHAGCPDRPTKQRRDLFSACCLIPHTQCAVRIWNPAHLPSVTEAAWAVQTQWKQPLRDGKLTQLPPWWCFLLDNVYNRHPINTKIWWMV